ncbi:inositol monophosphatase family protein [Nocardia mexicana]|uniref:3'(2'), 5'-bisphosphate nucleotidase n=1 Tax=Nocardia mexicana TaxID=279262 RepID=A0A370HB97_9NOCA|nr:inositol monophosphatase family protein [Nocardia mexicana]RDI54007.1 3'(2'), 5'-bisphosphate nucleotidase [Nocardia mexicana]
MDRFWTDLADTIVPSLLGLRSQISSLSIDTKPDSTLLTEADIEVQNLIVRHIRALDPNAYIIAEEDAEEATPLLRPGESVPSDVWIVDPIDGTAQFVKPDEVDFCSVVALYRDGQPVSALVVAPELGHGRQPVVMFGSIEEGLLTVNGEPVALDTPQPIRHAASTTRSGGELPSDIETALATKGFAIKHRTTSQTLDMVRTVIDLGGVSPVASPFDLFHRREQKLWDGAAGMCLATIADLSISDEDRHPILPLDSSFLSSAEPVLKSSLVGNPAVIGELLPYST